jgi:hypothetical protein
MVRIMRPNVKDAPYIENIRADKRTIQRGSLNDPVQQEGRLYFNADHTAYLYLDGYQLWFKPDNDSPVELT